jgi:hypothetical protein
MRRTLFATVCVVAACTLSASAFARDDGPRFVQDRLDALVAQHAEASLHIAQAKEAQHDARSAATSKTRRDQDAS